METLEIAQALGLPGAIIVALGWFGGRVFWPWYVERDKATRAAQQAERAAHLATLEKQAAEFQAVNQQQAASFDGAITTLTSKLDEHAQTWQQAVLTRDKEWRSFLQLQEAATTARAEKMQQAVTSLADALETGSGKTNQGA